MAYACEHGRNIHRDHVHENLLYKCSREVIESRRNTQTIRTVALDIDTVLDRGMSCLTVHWHGTGTVHVHDKLSYICAKSKHYLYSCPHEAIVPVCKPIARRRLCPREAIVPMCTPISRRRL